MVAVCVTFQSVIFSAFISIQHCITRTVPHSSEFMQCLCRGKGGYTSVNAQYLFMEAGHMTELI